MLQEIFIAYQLKKVFYLKITLGIHLISRLKFEVYSTHEHREFVDKYIGLIEAFICPRVPIELPVQQEMYGNGEVPSRCIRFNAVKSILCIL